jgi:hypothetical protein
MKPFKCSRTWLSPKRWWRVPSSRYRSGSAQHRQRGELSSSSSNLGVAERFLEVCHGGAQCCSPAMISTGCVTLQRSARAYKLEKLPRFSHRALAGHPLDISREALLVVALTLQGIARHFEELGGNLTEVEAGIPGDNAVIRLSGARGAKVPPMLIPMSTMCFSACVSAEDRRWTVLVGFSQSGVMVVPSRSTWR